MNEELLSILQEIAQKLDKLLDAQSAIPSGAWALLGTAIGGVSVAWFAWRLNRRRDEVLRREAVKSTAAALYGEVRELRARIAGLANVVAGHELHQQRPIKELLQSHMPGKPLIYESLAGKFGILPNKSVLSIVRFHAYVSEAIRGVELYTADIGTNYSPLAILDPAISAVEEAGTALDLLGIILKVPGETGPDIDAARDMKMREDYMWKLEEEGNNPQ